MKKKITKDIKRQIPLEIMEIGGGLPIKHSDYEKNLYAFTEASINKETKSFRLRHLPDKPVIHFSKERG